MTDANKYRLYAITQLRVAMEKDGDAPASAQMHEEQALTALLRGRVPNPLETLHRLESAGALDAESFQARVEPWMLACFGAEVAGDREERNHRFLEEALELVQAAGCTADAARALVAYVYGRPVGELGQEIGGVMVTLAALALANGRDMHVDGEEELLRVWGKIDVIRAKQAAKPKYSALPQETRNPAIPARFDGATICPECLILICPDCQGVDPAHPCAGHHGSQCSALSATTAWRPE